MWSAGGKWERFFLLAPALYAAYAIILGGWATYLSPSSDAFVRVSLVAFSYIALVDSWMTPIMSASVLRASIGTGLNRNDENAMSLAGYLEFLGQGGHWRFGNILSLAYLGTMLAWGLIAVAFPALTGIENTFAFGVVDTALLLLLWLSYRLTLKRFLRRARRAGYAVQFPLRCRA